MGRRQPAPSAARDLADPTARLTVLLRHLQVAVLGLLLCGFGALVLSRPDASLRATYTGLIVGLAVAVAVALRLNVTGRHEVSARLTILILVVPPWFSLAFDPTILRGDFVPMVFVLCPVMLAAMFLELRTVILLASSQWLGLAAVAAFGPSTGFNWASLLSLILAVNVLSTMYALIMRDQLRQISDTVGQLRVTQAELRHESWHDSLTGVFNRAYLDQQLPREIARAQRQQGVFGVVMIDIDHFKTINDTLGHGAGDDALRRVAELLGVTTRVSDYVCRFGGDEFIVLLPDASLADALVVAELIRARAQHTLQGPLPGTPGLTLSAGVAVYPNHGTTPDDLLRSADHALYVAKQGGRNRVALPVPA